MERNSIIDTTANRIAVESLFNALNNRDLSLLDSCLDEKANFDFPGTELIRGRKKIRLFFKILFRQYPSLHFNVESTLTEGNRACVLWTNAGEDRNGNPYNNRGITFIEFREGKIVYLSDYFKDTSFTKK